MDCPQTGVGGCHSDSWYDGRPCAWCGAPPEPDYTDEGGEA